MLELGARGKGPRVANVVAEHSSQAFAVREPAPRSGPSCMSMEMHADAPWSQHGIVSSEARASGAEVSCQLPTETPRSAPRRRRCQSCITNMRVTRGLCCVPRGPEQHGGEPRHATVLRRTLRPAPQAHLSVGH